MHEDELRFWANAHAPAGSEVAQAVLELFGKIDSLRAEAKEPVLDRAPEVVPIRMSQLQDPNSFEVPGDVKAEEMIDWLQRKKLEAFDGSTGTPEHGRCGRKENTPPGQ